MEIRNEIKQKEDKKEFKQRSLADIQRLRLEKLMKNPDKPVIIPENTKKSKDYVPPTFIRNVMGSSAGAGSGEFHVYRHLRRKEYARQKHMKLMTEKELQDLQFQEKLEENQRIAEEKTNKKREKRLKKKQKQKGKPKKPKIEEQKSESDNELSDNGSNASNDNDDDKSEHTGDEKISTNEQEKITEEPQEKPDNSDDSNEKSKEEITDKNTESIEEKDT